ncbi:hypothetical protein B0T25DRAFT_262523 [Lasiosphaeria hispida]|uniref:Uncharacterized protein n=1 Tax=Lasiosphaeria hispida TaxID=260671 RepID=A0AAJ0HGN1_9PEZI|nr:hypothetical protein B0T25DRAFT_262523 [Lasiosphaeria hispida]
MMRDNKPDSDFSFISYEGPKLPRDPNTRTLIRRRAMKDVAASRKQRGEYGRQNVNRRQFPVVLDSEETEDTPFQSTIASLEISPYPSDNSVVTAEGLSILLCLAPLTGLRLGLARLAHSPSESIRIADFFPAPRLGSSKLISFIPSRYGQVSALTHATNCVVAKFRFMMGIETPGGESGVLVHYSKALRALQAALDDEEQWFTPETLCATQLLGVFELLNGNGVPYSWMRHVGGATRLIEVRGVDAFKSEFEMALLTAHVGPAVTEAFLSNKPSFLASPAWHRILHTAILNDTSLAPQADLVLALWGQLVSGPEIFKRTTDLICAAVPPSQTAIDEVIDRILRDRASLAKWLCMAQQRLGLPIEGSAAVFPLGSLDATQLALRGTYATCTILKGRLLVALAPVRFRQVEIECQEMATRIMSLGDQSAGGYIGGGLVGSLLMSQGSWIALAIVKTKMIWEEETQESGGGMIERMKFEAWCDAMGRTLPGR